MLSFYLNLKKIKKKEKVCFEMSYSFNIYMCPKCGVYKHEKEMLINQIDQELICIDCATKKSPGQVKELMEKHLKEAIKKW